ncbi:DNA-directed RNA polymerases II 24 kDa polypeptide (RNA polymerase II subunit 5) [Thoreauomyces humboldtii]|nr:DNA-directed RNA polymerases II 24 kDa polypeptide (RNA polymerase II subunit 5) [Thoreauomyces humboldtii]
MDGDRDAARLWRVYKTIRELVRDRGYEVPQSEIDMSLDEFKSQYVGAGVVNRAGMTYVSHLSGRPTEQLLVFFTEEDSVGIKPIKKIAERMVTNSIFKAIVVYMNKMTPSAKKVVTEMAPKYILELFTEAELLVNITQHILVPKHEVLSDTEKKTLLER